MLSTIDLKEVLQPSDLERLEAEAARQNIAPSDVIRIAVEAYLDEVEAEELEDTPDEKILADLQEAWHEVQAGLAIPADEVLAALRKKLSDERSES